MPIRKLDELIEVELLAELAEEFPEQEPIVEIFLEVGDALGQLHLVVEPVD